MVEDYSHCHAKGILTEIGYAIVYGGYLKPLPKPSMTLSEARALGGRARAATLTPEQRSAQARKAALARWRGADDASEGTPTPQS